MVCLLTVAEGIGGLKIRTHRKPATGSTEALVPESGKTSRGAAPASLPVPEIHGRKLARPDGGSNRRPSAHSSA